MNCYSYAFHLSEGNTQKVWINPQTTNNTPNLSKYWTDGSFIEVCNESDADKAYYYSGDHAAVTSSSISGQYESKWGPNCRVIHAPTYSPYNPNRIFYASTRILGDNSNLCSGTRTFSVKNISGATYTWSLSSTLSVVGATNTNQLTVQRNGILNGEAYVEVQISTSCSSTPATNRVYFVAGTQAPTNIVGLNPPLGVSPGELLELDAAEGGLLSYNWSVEGGTILGYSDLSHVTIQVNQCQGQIYNGWINVHLSYVNSCGTGDAYGEYTTVDCGTGGGPFFAMSPNPAKDNLTIDGRQQNKSIKEVQILDKTGTVKKIVKYSGEQKLINLSISGLTSDMYYVRIYDGLKWESKQLRVQ